MRSAGLPRPARDTATPAAAPAPTLRDDGRVRTPRVERATRSTSIQGKPAIDRSQDAGWIEDFLLASSTEAIVRHDAAGRLLWVCPNARLIFGPPQTTLLASDPREVHAGGVPAPYRQALEESLPEITVKGASSAAYKVRMRNGTERWLESFFTGVFGPEGELTEIRSLTRDIDRFKRPLEELAVREEHWRAALDALPIVLIQVDSRLHVVGTNRCAATLFNDVPRQLIGHDLVTLLCATGTEDERALRRLMTHTAYGETEIWSSVAERWLSIAFYPVLDTRGRLREALVRLVDITPRRRMEEKLQRSIGGLRQLASRLQSVREEERSRISREIHDELGDHMTGLSLNLGWLRDRLGPGKHNGLVRKVDHMLTILDHTWSAIRRISTELRPAVLDHLGLAAAVQWQCDEFHQRTGTTVQLDMDPSAAQANDQVSTMLFRVLQEALTNIARHANARRVTVTLTAAESQLVLVVRDDGKGFDPHALTDGVHCGLFGMEQRAVELGGHCRIESAPNGGTKVEVRVPAL